MNALRPTIGVLLALAVALGAPAASAAENDPVTVPVQDGPYVELYGEGDPICLSDLGPGSPPPVDDCMAPNPLYLAVTYGCDAIVRPIETGPVQYWTVVGSATTNDPRVISTRIVCTVRLNDDDIAQTSASSASKAAQVSETFPLFPAQYSICASGYLRYLQNGAARVHNFGDAGC